MNLLLVCFVACVALALCEHPGHAEMEALKKQCQAEVRATDADAAAMRPIPSTRGASCIMACMQKKWGMMNADNTFNAAAFTEKMSHMKERDQDMYNKMVIVINTCKAQETAQTDQCDAAKALATCMQTQRAAQGLPDYHH